jgi:S-adenosylmethionine:tRNA ribosyltransferase-isomerase
MRPMRVSDFNYNLPEKLIAQHPPQVRGDSRLLVVNRTHSTLSNLSYKDFTAYVQPGDIVVLNDTKVIRARLNVSDSKGRLRELLLLEDHHNTDLTKRQCLYRGKLKAGEKLSIESIQLKVEKILGDGIAEIAAPVSLLALADKVGSVPLPPYMHRSATKEDVVRYQTVFAEKPGSVAAPTASLNLTQDMIDKIVAKNATIAYLTLHVGLGTFLPIRSDEVEQHQMHSEYFEIPPKTADAIQAAKRNGKRTFAVGTTVARTLEYCADQILSEKSGPLSGEADIFIYPGYNFRIVDALLTNFHAPKTTVLMLAAAFAGWDLLKRSYEEAVSEEYAFLSYGDSMLIH